MIKIRKKIENSKRDLLIPYHIFLRNIIKIKVFFNNPKARINKQINNLIKNG